jgi:AcrR family transcriptional regulator
VYENFEKLPEEKKKKIIEVCIDEFAEKGYTSASTNNIVSKANISKGTLFNYFINKKNLFLYIVDYATDYYVEYLISRMKENSPDFFQRILDWAELKIAVSIEEPKMYDFFVSAFVNIPEELAEDIAERYKKLYDKGVVLAFEDIDMSPFREDIDREKALELILLAFNGVSEKNLKQIAFSEDKGFKALNDRLEELKVYAAILKKVFYKM